MLACLVELHTEGSAEEARDTRREGSTMNWYEIRVQRRLDQRWSEWFDGLAITYDADDNTVLCGPLVDEAALFGVLIKVRDLALPLLAVNRVKAAGEEQERKPA
jgi:hypothetical protein